MTRGCRLCLARLGLVLLVSGVALLFAEIALRTLGIDAPSGETGIVPHPLWHHWHRSNFDFDYDVAAEGYSVPVHFNEHGMRDRRTLSIEKPPGVRRIALLGDSFAEAMQVNEEESVARRVEHYLSSPETPVEVLNFGCSGFSTVLQLAQFRHWVRHFDPDVVVCLHHFSDMTEDWRLRSLVTDGNDGFMAVPGSRGTSRIVYQWLELSQLFRVGASAARRCRHHRPPPADASLQVSYDAIVHEPYAADDQTAWNYSLDALAEMSRLVAEMDRTFLVVLIPIGTQVEPVDASFAERTGLRYLAGGKRLDNTGYQKRMAAFCYDQGLACLDLLPAFREANPEGLPRFYLPHDQHWTPAGHDLAAQLITAVVGTPRRASQRVPQG